MPGKHKSRGFHAGFGRHISLRLMDECLMYTPL